MASKDCIHEFFWMSFLTDQSKGSHNLVEELTYRRALRMALDILNCCAPTEEDSSSKGRRAKPATHKETAEEYSATLMASHHQLSSAENGQKRKRRDKTSNAPQTALIKNKCNVSSRENAAEASSCKSFACRLRPRQSNKELDSQCCPSISKTKIPGTPPKDVQRKPFPKCSGVRKSPRFLKKDLGHLQGRDKSGMECHSPSPVSLSIQRESIPNSTPNSCPRLTQRGKKSTAIPGLRRALVVSPVKHASTNLADHSLEQEEAPPKKCSKASDGSRCLEDAEGIFRQQQHAALSVSQERQCRSCPKILNCGLTPDGLVLEHKEENHQSSNVNTARNFQFQDLEDEGLESTSDLSLRLSPKRESSLSPAFRDEEEEEELPSILLHQVFLQGAQDLSSNSFFISFKNLKHFDCEEKQILIDKARENYCGEINWCIDLISDYRIRVETYLEDDGQQELVVNYLREVYQEVGAKRLRLRNGDSIRLILDVLFPEAIIYAISAVDHIDYKKAEEKYKRGPLVTQREREIFEEEILEKKKRRHLQCE
ncbi:hypothetical protein lerEdw1_005673 [Lerista edwardsae]|nr:hypothetical protein lerEdw1_005673 [Lerista edwardsae]